jgi:aminoglycoside phosphotransferase (APT) family kinase protein
MSESPESMAAGLQAELRRDAPQLGVRSIEKIARLTSGLSSQSYRVEADTDDGPATWVMRVEPEHGVIPPYDIAREYRLLEAMERAELPVPHMLYLGEDKNVVGGRFLLMSFIVGEIYRSRDARLDDDPETLKSVQEQFVEMLARIHAAPQDVYPQYATGPEAVRAQVAICRDRMKRTELLPTPVLRHALDLLEREAPKAQRIGLLHGDYRLPNLMWHEGRISGILDWELAAVGDPLSDLAFTQTVGAGPCSVEGPLAEHYSKLTGVEIDGKKIIYYKLLEMVKSTIIGLAGANDLAQGGSDLRLLSVATLALSGQAVFAMLEQQLEAYQEA